VIFGTTEDTAASGNHNHDAKYSSAGHNHDSAYSLVGHNHDDLYYTENEVDAKLTGYSLITHNHEGVYSNEGHNHDDLYFTEAEVNTKFGGYAPAGHNHDAAYVKKGAGLANYAARWTDANTIGAGSIYDTGTNVGIGTTSPSNKLDVSGAVKATAFFGDGSGLTGISGASKWTEGTGGIYYNSGKVGIGTTNPGTKLDIYDGQLRLTNGSVGGAYVDLDSDSAGNFIVNTNGTGRNFVFKQGGIETARINSAGYVGIGESAPSQRLDVAGTVKAAAFIGDGSCLTNIASSHDHDASYIMNGTSPQTANLNITGNAIFGGKVGIGTTVPIESLHIKNGAIGFEDVSNTIRGWVGMVGYDPSFRFENTAGPTTIGSFHGEPKYSVINFNVGAADPGSTVMTVAANGNVGIGTTGPSEKLEVNGTVKAGAFIGDGSLLTGTSQWLDGTGGIYYNSGNVGIGTTSPLQILDIKIPAVSKYGIRFERSSKSDTLGGVYEESDGDGSFLLTNVANALTVKLMSGGDTYFNGGNVGIGTTGPVCKLHVESNGNGEHFQIKNSVNRIVDMGESSGKGYLEVRGASDALNIRFDGDGASWINSGNVGIGTTSPKSKLEVSGQIYQNSTGTKMIFKSPDGTCSACGPDNSDVWTCSSVACP
jgi:hypothetical protein